MEKTRNTEPATNGPWKWLSYPSGAKLLAGRERAVIHCPDAPMSINDADQALIASAPDLRDALKGVVMGWDSDDEEQFHESIRKARKLLGFKAWCSTNPETCVVDGCPYVKQCEWSGKGPAR